MEEIPSYITAELGTDRLPEFDPAVVGAIELPKPAEETKSIAATVASTSLRVLVEGTTYVVKDNKLYVESVKGDKTYDFLVSSLIVVVANARDINGKNWGKVVRFVDPDNAVKQIFIRNSDLIANGRAIITQLSEDGLQVSSNGKMIELLLHYLNMAPPMEKKMAICTDRIGWHGNIYLFPDNSYIGNSDTCVVYTGAASITANTVKGTVQEWRDNVAAICKGNNLLIFAICIAFASVLLRLLKVESGGFHFFGTSSTGKSTTLFVGASAHGDPDKIISSWNATAVGLEYNAKERNDSLMILDEMHETDEKTASKTGYSLFNPKGKTRGNKLGGVNEGAERRLNCLSSGEVSYGSFVKDIRPGQAVRLNDIPADMEKGFGVFENIHDSESAKAFSERIKHVTTEYYGAPIRSFLEQLVNSDPNTVKDMYQEISAKFFTDYVPEQADTQVQRVTSKYAVAALAGELATIMGITGWDENDAYSAVGVVFNKWLDNRGTIGQQEPERAVEQVKDFLLQHGMSRFLPITDNSSSGYSLLHPDRQCNDMAGFRIVNGPNSYEFIVFPKVYNDEMCSGLVIKNVTKTLTERGFLEVEHSTDGKVKPQVRHRLPGVGQMRVYHFNASIFGDSDEFDTEESGEAIEETEAEQQ